MLPRLLLVVLAAAARPAPADARAPLDTVSESASVFFAASETRSRGMGDPDGAQVAVVPSADSPHYREALAGFREAFGGAVLEIRPEAAASLPAGVRAAAAFGAKAARADYPARLRLVYAMALGADVPRARSVRVSTLGSPETIAELLKALSPGASAAAFPYVAAAFESPAAALKDALSARGVRLSIRKLESARELPEYLRSLGSDVHALFVPPDSALLTEQTFSTFERYACARSIPFYVAGDGLAERGATASLAVAHRDVGRLAAATVSRLLAGETVPEIVFVDAVGVTVNRGAARRCRVSLGKRGLSRAERVLP